MLRVEKTALTGYNYLLNHKATLKGGFSYSKGGKMATGEVISIIAVCLSFIGVVSSFVFNYRKADKERSQERELNIKSITTIKNNIENISGDISDIKKKFDKIDDKMNSDHERIINHETRIQNLENKINKGA